MQALRHCGGPALRALVVCWRVYLRNRPAARPAVGWGGAKSVTNRTVRVAFAAILVCSTVARADERAWTTTRTTSTGDTVTLHWVSVYEGRDTVHNVEFSDRDGSPSELKVVGQPVFSPSSRFVAFPDCADDGCRDVVSVVDLEARSVIERITLPYEGQIYVSCEWAQDTLEVSVDVPSAGSPKGDTHVHRYEVSGSG